MGLQAANDPICPSVGIPREEIKVRLLLLSFLIHTVVSLPYFQIVLISQGAICSLWLNLFIDFTFEFLSLVILYVLSILIAVVTGKSKLFVDYYTQRWPSGVGCGC